MPEPETLTAPTATKKKYVEVTFNNQSSYSTPFEDFDFGAFACDFDGGSDVGDKWTLEIIEMTDDEYSALPEFEGH